MALQLLEQEIFAPELFAPVFRQLSSAYVPRPAASRRIALDVAEAGKHYEILANLPGVEKQDIKLDVDKDVLTVSVSQSSQKEEDKENEGVKWHRNERSSTYQRRSIKMPDDADMANVKAKYENGVLQVDIPKLEQSARITTIQVQ